MEGRKKEKKREGKFWGKESKVIAKAIGQKSRIRKYQKKYPAQCLQIIPWNVYFHCYSNHNYCKF